MSSLRPARGMTAFMIFWFGQFVSSFSSTVSIFAVNVWIFQETGSATQFALASFTFVLPYALLSSIAGTLVDRWDRRWTMMGADTGQAAVTLFLASMVFTDQLAVWHVYVSGISGAIFAAFHGPASGAATTMLVPKEQLARVGGLSHISGATSRLIAPTAAGFLMISIGLKGIILIDLATYLFAAVTYGIIRIPQPPLSKEAARVKGSFRLEMRFGWSYLFSRPGLIGLVVLSGLLNFFGNIGNTLTIPMVLAFADADAVGIIAAVGAIGGLVSGSLFGIFASPRRIMNSILRFIALGGVGMIVSGWLPLFLCIATGRLIVGLAFPCAGILMGSLEKRKIAADVQGRVFGTMGVIELTLEALAYPVAGLLADRIFEPLMMESGSLAVYVGPIIGIGVGRGMGLLSILMGVCLILTALGTYHFPRIRFMEQELADALPEAV